MKTTDRMMQNAWMLLAFSAGMGIALLIVAFGLKSAGSDLLGMETDLIFFVGLTAALASIATVSRLSNTVGLGYTGFLATSPADFVLAVNEYEAFYGDDDETD